MSGKDPCIREGDAAADLSQDPRPSYQDDPERMYGMGYAGMEVKFQVKDGRLLVRDIETASKDPAQEEKGRK